MGTPTGSVLAVDRLLRSNLGTEPNVQLFGSIGDNMQKIEWITYKGRRILFCDFSGYNEQQYLDGIGLMETELLAQPRGSRPLLIIDVTGSYMSKKTNERARETVEKLTAKDIITTTALVGVTGVKKIIAQAISRDVYFARDMESAKTWLITPSP